MRDPHVRALKYQFDHGGRVSYRNPSKVEFTTEDFDGALEDGILTVKLKSHCSHVAAARALVERYLRAWELHDRLQGLKDEIAFEFEGAEVVDRDPPPPGSPQVVELKAAVMSMSAASLSLHVTRNSYPKPPAAFAVTPDVETMWQRYLGYQEGKEPLLSMAFFCLSLLEASAGSRKAAAKKYRIQHSLLRKIGELTSTRGDGGSARKANARFPLVPLSPIENRWIEKAVQLMIARVAEVAAGKNVEELQVGALPKL